MTLIQVFEYDDLTVGESETFKKKHWDILAEYQEKYSDSDFPFYSVAAKNGKPGIKFKSYVGAIYVGDLTIEVLPKIYKDGSSVKKEVWRERMIYMLSTVYGLNIGSFSEADQDTLNDIPILDIFLKTFLTQTNELLHNGLVKRYNTREDNLYCLKGRLLFNKHIAKNLLHSERFYVSHVVYDYNNVFNSIIKQALEIIPSLTKDAMIRGLAKKMLLDFPDVKPVTITSELFSQLQYDRKTEDYRDTISLAEILLLHYATNLNAGEKTMMALMFDMNDLWEKFVFESLLNHIPKGWIVKSQVEQPFWKNTITGEAVKIRPDILCKNPEGDYFILDTKWKNIQYNNHRPATEDLFQLYSYRREFMVDGKSIKKVSFIYPSPLDKVDQHCTTGKFISSDITCDLITIPFLYNLRNWQEKITNTITDWCQSKE